MLPGPLLGPAEAAGRLLHSLYLACAPAQLPRCCGPGHSAGIRRNVGRYTSLRVSFSVSSFLYGEVVNHCEQLHLLEKHILQAPPRQEIKYFYSYQLRINILQLLQHGAATRPHRLVPLVNNLDTGQQLVLDAGPLTYLGAGWIMICTCRHSSCTHDFRQKMVYLVNIV